ncbi:MAG: FHA domain-containing protein [Planctomycetota bacterium]|jgi:hypothetical protein
MAKLSIQHQDRTTLYEILDDIVVIGGGEGAMVRLADPQASYEHCQIKSQPGGGLVLIDLESKNGTKVNGAFVNQCRLNNGDVIQIGDTRIALEAADLPAPAAAAPAAPARAVPAAAPARAAPVVGRRPAIDPRRPSVPTAAPPAKPPRPPAAEREPRMRRYQSGVPTPIILLGVAVGLLLFLVAALYFGNPAPSKNQEIWTQMGELMVQRRYEEAIQLAKQADPVDDRDWYDRVRLRLQDAEMQLEGKLGRGAGKRAKDDLDAVEIYIQNNRADIEGIRQRWEEYIRKYEGTFWAEQAKIRMKETTGHEAPGTVRAPETPRPEGTARIDREYETATAQAGSLRDADRFQEAIDTLWDFFEENQGRARDLEAWRERVESAVEEIKERAEERWQELDERATSHVEKGEISKAVDIYKRIAERFGMERYQALATEKKKELLLK